MVNAHTWNKQCTFEYIIHNCRKSSHYYVEVMAVLEMDHAIWIATINKDITIDLISNRPVQQRCQCRTNTGESALLPGPGYHTEGPEGPGTTLRARVPH